MEVIELSGGTRFFADIEGVHAMRRRGVCGSALRDFLPPLKKTSAEKMRAENLAKLPMRSRCARSGRVILAFCNQAAAENRLINLLTTETLLENVRQYAKSAESNVPRP